MRRGSKSDDGMSTDGGGRSGDETGEQIVQDRRPPQ